MNDSIEYAREPSPENWRGYLVTRFGLTRAELRFAEAFFHAGSIAGAAETLGIARSTARQHLQRTARKTRASGQAEVMKILCLLRLRGSLSE